MWFRSLVPPHSAEAMMPLLPHLRASHSDISQRRSAGSCLTVWPETDQQRARQIAQRDLGGIVFPARPRLPIFANWLNPKPLWQGQLVQAPAARG